ncbi:hypothetical protein HaLaN_10980 [Haematococcus lacustris]|uniref:Uncharacterized protein n=1 Tax=Haematococcus lacustris TaxID=44745 RepID=A0A699Z7N0_HAELA|nr:hypothetical protein HaLaN_10980 [Haematococcus lacustris]
MSRLPPTLLPEPRAIVSTKGAHITVPQRAAAAPPGPWEACLAPACSPGQGTPCPWLAELPGWPPGRCRLSLLLPGAGGGA